MKFPLIIIFLLAAMNSKSQVVINELVASNDSLSLFSDEYGEYDDWVELYNMGSASVDLGNYYIADADTTLDKWQIPLGTNIPANGYLIIWTDNDDNNGQVPLHTNFRLSAAGEMVVLSNPNLQVVDQVTFGAQVTNVAYARIPNGTGNFTSNQPTPGAFNEPLSSTNSLDAIPLLVFPNPTSDIVYLKLEKEVAHPVPYELIDAQGKILKTGLLKQETKLSIAGLPNGNYFIRYRIDKIVSLIPLQKN